VNDAIQNTIDEDDFAGSIIVWARDNRQYRELVREFVENSYRLN
jgi:hypothetical protein